MLKGFVTPASFDTLKDGFTYGAVLAQPASTMDVPSAGRERSPISSWKGCHYLRPSRGIRQGEGIGRNRTRQPDIRGAAGERRSPGGTRAGCRAERQAQPPGIAVHRLTRPEPGQEMRAVVQRVSECSVHVEDRLTGKIGAVCSCTSGGAQGYEQEVRAICEKVLTCVSSR